MGKILEVAEALWNGEKTVYTQHPFGPPYGPEQITETTWFIKGFANTIVRSTPDGLVIIDPAGSAETDKKHRAVRSFSQQPLHTAVYTHGHVDHVFGVDQFLSEVSGKDAVQPRVIAHEAILDRFNRYRTTNEWNRHINGRQFLGGGKADFPSEFRRPDIVYRDQLDITVGGTRVMLRHARGETDDHTWVFFPDEKVLATGDLVIWAVPNGGNPQKVQRYVGEWATALRSMLALEPEVLLPGHGLPIIGKDRVAQLLSETATYLESVYDQVLQGMNQGESLDTIVQQVEPPEELSQRAFLQPIYDECEFLVRNIWRQFGGWYDGTPSHLKPASEGAQATEIARLAGGAVQLIQRAGELADEGNFKMACHLAEWAVNAGADEPAINKAAAEIFSRRAETETSTMAVGIYRDMARRLSESADQEVLGETVIKSQMNRD
jgi:alkyl sulfatase BDS1-like metallo-beta-lactamase superfamily hydrolase